MGETSELGPAGNSDSMVILHGIQDLIAQMGAGLDHEIRLDFEIGPITVYILSGNMKP